MLSGGDGSEVDRKDFEGLAVYTPDNLPQWQLLKSGLVDGLDRFTVALGRSFPLTFLSLFRTPEKNAAVGGVSTSWHLVGGAADFVVDGDPLEWLSLAERAGFTGIGLYINPANAVSMHVDIRPGGAARWSRVDGVMGGLQQAIERIRAAGLTKPDVVAGAGVIFLLTVLGLYYIFKSH